MAFDMNTPDEMQEQERFTKGGLTEKNGIWQATFYDRLRKKTIFRTTGIPVGTGKRGKENSKKAAMVAQQEIRATLGLQPVKKGTTRAVTDMLKLWLKKAEQEGLVSQATLDAYRLYSDKRIIPFFQERYPNLLLKDLTHAIMRDYANYCKDGGLTADSVRKYMAPIKATCAYCFDQNLISKNPLADFKYSPKGCKSSDTKKRALSAEEIENLYEAIDSDFQQPVVLPILLALECGLRREEILGLKYASVSLGDNSLEVKDTVTKIVSVVRSEKTKTEAGMRTVYFSERTKKAIELFASKKERNKLLLKEGYNECDYVYVTEEGNAYYPDSVTKQLSRFLKKHKLASFSLHELRHTYCTMLFQAGFDMKTAQYLMGHKDIRMTMDLYNHAIPEKAQYSKDLVENFLKQNSNLKPTA